MDQALRSASPLHVIDIMPKSSAYYIFHCEEDKAVNKQMHSDRFVKELERAHKVSYYAVPERGHCDLTEEMRALYTKCVTDSILGVE